MRLSRLFLSASLVDITDEAIAAIDAQLGDGRTEGQDGVGPQAAPDAGEAPAAGQGRNGSPGTGGE